MASHLQGKVDKMYTRQYYRNVWHVDLLGSVGADFPFCCFAFCCGPCASYMLRKRTLYNDMSRYKCCGGFMPCSGSCGEKKCPEFCLCTEVSCCFANSVASTRFMLQDEFNLQTTKCDNCIIGFMFCIQQVACIFSLVACITGSEEIEEAAHCLSCLADLVYYSVCPCMQTQHKLELDKRDGKLFPQPAFSMGYPPPVQQMSRMDQAVPPVAGYPPPGCYPPPSGYPAPVYGYGYPYPPPPYPGATAGYPPQSMTPDQKGYAPQSMPANQQGYPPQSMPPDQKGYAPQSMSPDQKGYAPQSMQSNQQGYPPQSMSPDQKGYAPQGMPSNQEGYPPQSMSPDQKGYAPQSMPSNQQGYPPQSMSPNQQGYPPQGIPPNQQGYPPQSMPPNQQGYPPQSMPPNQQGYPPQSMPPNSKDHP